MSWVGRKHCDVVASAVLAMLQVDRRAVLRSSGDGSAALSSRTQAEHSCLTRHSSLTQTLYSG